MNALWGVRDIGFARVQGFDALTATQDLAGRLSTRNAVRAQPVGARLARRRHLHGRRSLHRRRWTEQRPATPARGRRPAKQRRPGALGRHPHQRTRGGIPAVDSDHHDDALARVQRRVAAAHSIQSLAQRPRRRRARLRVVEHAGRTARRRPHREPHLRRMAPVRANRLRARRFRRRGATVGGRHSVRRVDADPHVGGRQPARRSAARIRANLARRCGLRVNPEPGGHRFELRFSNTNKTTFFLAEPSDISATREHTVPSSVFRWPK